jgi:hypothetical protein
MIILELEEKITQIIESVLKTEYVLMKGPNWIRFRNGKTPPALSIAGVLLFSATNNGSNWMLPNSSSYFYYVNKVFGITSDELQAIESGWMNEYINISSMNRPDFFNLGKKLAEKYLKDK